MINCPNCTHFNGERCDRFGRQPNMAVCPYAEEIKPRNHFEMLKSMSMEEMAEFLRMVGGCGPYHDKNYCNRRPHCSEDCWLDWLKEAIE